MLTFELLREQIPRVQGGDELVRRDAQEILVTESSGLLRTWAGEERRRASHQLGAVSDEDVYAIMVAHFIAALDHVDLGKLRTSATNYLYHKVVPSTRRELHATYGTVRFSSEFLEESRRAKAIESRLHGELGRLPTDEEIIEASRQGTSGIHLGSRERNCGSTQRKPLTGAFITRWRRHAVLLEMGEMPSEDVMGGYGHVPDQYAEQRQAIRSLFTTVAERAGLDLSCVKLLFDVYGIADNDEQGPRSVAEAAPDHHFTVTRARQVVNAWVSMCRAPGSPFHQVLSELSNGDLVGVGMVRVLADLGDYHPPGVPAPEVLRAASGEDSTAAATSMAFPSR